MDPLRIVVRVVFVYIVLLLASLAGALALAFAGPLLPATPGVARLGAALGVYLATFVLGWLAMPHGVRDTMALVDTLRELGVRRRT